jgi:acyl carrier protein
MTNRSSHISMLLLIIILAFPSVGFSEVVTKETSWHEDINDVLTMKNDKMNIGLIIETKISELDEYLREQLENEEENQFFSMIEKYKDKYKVTGRRHLIKVLEEHGITGSETGILHKISNLDVIVIREIYNGSKMTKVLKVDTGEVLLFKTYEKEKYPGEGWVLFATSQYGGHIHYDKLSMKTIRPNVVKVWIKENVSIDFKNGIINDRRKENKPIGGWDSLDHVMYLLEVDCKEDVVYVFKYKVLNNEGGILESYNFPDPKIQPRIPNGDTFDLTFTKVCTAK